MSLIDLIKNNKLTAIKIVSGTATLAAVVGYEIQNHVAALPAWKRGAAAVIDRLGLLGTLTSPAIHAAYHASELPPPLYTNALVVGALAYITADVAQKLSK